MSDVWKIEFAKGYSYEDTITITGVADIATATGWFLSCAMPNEAPFLAASTANGLLIAGASSNQKLVRIPAATTANFPVGNGRFDFWIEWAGGRKIPYYLGGPVTVQPYTGQIA